VPKRSRDRRTNPIVSKIASAAIGMTKFPTKNFQPANIVPPRIDGQLFPLGPNQTTMLFVRAAKRASLEDCRLHDLRHTFASYQAMAGVAGRGLQVLLGHRDARMTMRYSHLSDAYLKAAVDGVVLGRSNPDRAKEASNAAASDGQI
jgi:integrase